MRRPKTWRRWTAQDDHYLLNTYPLLGNEVIAAHLGRARHAIAVHARRLGTSKADAHGWTVRDVADALGVHRVTVNHWITSGRLAARRRGSNSTLVTDAALRAFGASAWGKRRIHWDLVPDREFAAQLLGWQVAA